MFLVLKKEKLVFFAILILLIVVVLFGAIYSIQKAVRASNILMDDIGCEGERDLKPQDPPMEGDDVAEIQIQLKRMGHYQGEIDGIYTGEIIESVKRLQREFDLEENGVVNSEFFQAIYIGDTDTETDRQEPPKGELKIVIDLDKNRLTLYSDGEEYRIFPIAIGKASTQSPVGDWTIINKGHMPGNAFGTRWMGLNVPWGTYGIHGTNNPGSIGYAQSAGCIRMFNKDVEKLFEWVKVGTKVSINSNRWPPSFRSEYRRGMKGQDVVYVQRALSEFGFCPGGGDARFGEETENQVKDFQRHFNLPVTGVVDENILYLLGLR